MMSARNVHVALQISAHEYLNYYSGTVKDVVATASDGRKIRFPASILRPFVSQDGVRGEFVIGFDDSNKFISIHKV